MIRAIIAALFAEPTPRSWVPGLGMLNLPGAIAFKRIPCSVGRRARPTEGR